MSWSIYYHRISCVFMFNLKKLKEFKTQLTHNKNTITWKLTLYLIMYILVFNC